MIVEDADASMSIKDPHSSKFGNVER
jgi:hypothetical protein